MPRCFDDARRQILFSAVIIENVADDATPLPLSLRKICHKAVARTNGTLAAFMPRYISRVMPPCRHGRAPATLLAKMPPMLRISSRRCYVDADTRLLMFAADA